MLHSSDTISIITVCILMRTKSKPLKNGLHHSANAMYSVSLGLRNSSANIYTGSVRLRCRLQTCAVATRPSPGRLLQTMLLKYCDKSYVQRLYYIYLTLICLLKFIPMRVTRLCPAYCTKQLTVNLSLLHTIAVNLTLLNVTILLQSVNY